MHCDSRGGHNRTKINEDFFKHWSDNMAYVLGYICADGSVIDARKSSRTCYLAISSVDRNILLQIRRVMRSSHKLYVRQPRISKFWNGEYLGRRSYIYKVGSKHIFQSLVDLGITPRKSLRLKVPAVPTKYWSHFLRGYYDGDGCVSFYKPKNRTSYTVKVIFTSGTQRFLQNLQRNTSKILLNSNTRAYINQQGSIFRLIYQGGAAKEILKFMYHNINHAPYLSRKYQIYSCHL